MNFEGKPMIAQYSRVCEVTLGQEYPRALKEAAQLISRGRLSLGFSLLELASHRQFEIAPSLFWHALLFWLIL